MTLTMDFQCLPHYCSRWMKRLIQIRLVSMRNNPQMPPHRQIKMRQYRKRKKLAAAAAAVVAAHKRHQLVYLP